MYSKKIHALRKSHNMTKEELAKELDVSLENIVDWEKGVAMPDLKSVIKMSDLFNVSTDYLLKEDGNRYSFYPKEKEEEKHLSLHSLVALIIFVLSILMFFTLIIVSVTIPHEYYDQINDITHIGLKAYWYQFLEIKIGIIINAIAFIVSLLVLINEKIKLI